MISQVKQWLKNLIAANIATELAKFRTISTPSGMRDLATGNADGYKVLTAPATDHIHIHHPDGQELMAHEAWIVLAEVTRTIERVLTSSPMLYDVTYRIRVDVACVDIDQGAAQDRAERLADAVTNIIHVNSGITQVLPNQGKLWSMRVEESRSDVRSPTLDGRQLAVMALTIVGNARQTDTATSY